MELTSDWYELLIGMLFGSLVLLLAASACPAAQFNEEIFEMVFEQEDSLKRHVRQAMEHYVDDPDKVVVQAVPYDKTKMLAGHYKEIRIEMVDAIVKDLLVEKAIIHLFDPIVDYEALLSKHKFRFKSPGRAEVLLVVHEEAVNELFQKKRKKLKLRNSHINFVGGRIRFSGSIRTFLGNQRIHVAGVLTPKKGKEVHFHPRSLNVGLLPIPRFILRTVAKRVNPIVSFDEFAFNLSLGAIETTNDRIYISSKGFHERALILAKSGKSRAVD